MARFFVPVAVFFAVLAVTASSPKDDNPAGVPKLRTEIKVVDNIKNFRSRNPLTKLTPLSRSAQPKGQTIYTLGGRVGGDRLAAQSGDSQLFGPPQDVQLVLTYPQSGVGAIISYVEITCDQSSNLGDAYVVDGGIGQRSITIVVEALHTTFFTYVAQIYGY